MLPPYTNEKGFQRKIKREIKAKEHSYILKVPPFFTDEAQYEIEQRGIAENPVRTDAGIELKGQIDLLYRMHLELQVPSRILMAVDEFRAGAVEELFRKTARIPWELYINPLLPVKIRSRVRNSRIGHEGSAAKTLIDAVNIRFSTLPGSVYVREHTGRTNAGTPVAYQQIYLTVNNNQCRLSIDTSGEHLHKRGYRTLASDAPIRETLAAGFLIWVLKRTGQPDCILDPMCGSGTLPIESAMMSSLSSIHKENQLRRFRFEDLPWHRRAAWEYEKKQPLHPLIQPVPVYASDIDGKTAAAAETNGAGSPISFSTASFFSCRSGGYPSPGPGIILANLPYGIRRPEGDRDFFKKFRNHCRDAFPGWTAACICPEQMVSGGVRDRISFYNGGIRVQGMILDIY